MDHPTSTSKDDEDEAQSLSERFAYHSRLRSDEPNRHDLFDPPNNVEAFIRLEAALDEFKHQIASGKHDVSGDQLLEPPTTAERFLRIEAAIDELLAQTVNNQAQSQVSTGYTLKRGRKAHHRLKKRPSQQNQRPIGASTKYSNASETAWPDTHPSTTEHDLDDSGNSNSSTFDPPRDTYGPSKDARRTAEYTHASARTVPLPGEENADPAASFNGWEMFEQDMDIFRSAHAMEEFLHQTFHNAREKYM